HHLLFSPPPPPPALSALSLHDALPISSPFFCIWSILCSSSRRTLRIATRASSAFCLTSFTYSRRRSSVRGGMGTRMTCPSLAGRSEEHTSELQSRGHLVCRLLLEKKK